MAMDGSDISLRGDRRPSALHDPDELLWRQFGGATSAPALVGPVPQPQHDGEATPRLRYDVARPIEADGELVGVVAVDVSPRSERDADATVRQLQWGGAWLGIARLGGGTSRAAA